MAQKSIQGSKYLALQIKNRRNHLGLTIEEAASRAGVGTKSWSRYEAGESIRVDKCKGICKALNWTSFPEETGENDEIFSVNEYRNHEAWSVFLENAYGDKAALAFAVGSDILLDYIKEDLDGLASMHSGSHIGQLNTSFLSIYLPKQFLMSYDYNFLYRMKCELCTMRLQAKYGLQMIAHSVMAELIIYLCNEVATILVESSDDEYDEEDAYREDWVFDLFDDMDIITYLYSDKYLQPDHPYHISSWYVQQFYLDE